KLSLRKDCTLEKGGGIRGVVTAENGGPIPGARVYASFSSYRYATTTGKDGRYRLVGLVPNEGVDYRGRPQLYGLGVSTPADSPHMGAGEQLNVKAGEEIGRDVILTVGATIRGKVTDAAGKPVPDARIEVYKEVGRGGRSYYGSAGPGPGRGVRTVADGTFVVHKLPSETLDVSASPPDDANLLAAEHRGVRCRAGETADVNLTLKAGGEIEGTVTDPAGKPILGAQVTLSSRAAGQRLGWGRQIQPVDTDAKGAFRFAGLPGGSYEVTAAVFDGENVVRGESVEVETGAKAEVKLRAVKGGFIEVTATGPDGEPIENGNARATPGTPGRPGGYGTVRSGRAVIGPLPPDTYTVQVTAYTVGERTFAPETIAGVTVKSGERVKRSVALKEGPRRERPRRPTRGGTTGGLGGPPAEK
ncbi:MAG TPA: carboxypeptidase-like regulatory domain-containing protein, partial [Planctomycetota bacterium]|nr:carboxypeptidase-like regulatory domain-containing protein [Planctomycetota bacterium]